MTSLRGPTHNGGGPEACCSVQICQLRALEKALIYHGDPLISTVLVQKNPVWLEDNIAHSMHAGDDDIITAFSGGEGTPNGTSRVSGGRRDYRAP